MKNPIGSAGGMFPLCAHVMNLVQKYHFVIWNNKMQHLRHVTTYFKSPRMTVTPRYSLQSTRGKFVQICSGLITE